jgi:hypothetical protein
LSERLVAVPSSCGLGRAEPAERFRQLAAAVRRLADASVCAVLLWIAFLIGAGGIVRSSSGTTGRARSLTR